MNGQTHFANARVILETEVITGGVTLKDGLIDAVLTGADVPEGAIDCEGDFLSPGLIELHTDNLERHIAPRPKVDWPHAAAIVGHDAELAGVGITTVFDAVRVGSIVSTGASRYPRHARELVNEVQALAGQLKISHYLHLRAEVCSETLLEELAEFGSEDRVGIVSLMDHTPGQRQFSDLVKFEAYVRGKKGMSAEEFAAHKAHLYALQARLGVAHEAGVVAEAKRLDAVLASHDDTTAEQVATSARHGISLGEFPTTRVAAQACRAAGISIIMGAPNLVRGASHSGNVAALELAELDLLDILSSDYVPSALLLGAVRLGLLWDDMCKGMATVTRAPALRSGLTDRGVIAPGMRADLLRFAMVGDVALPRGVWSRGARVA